MNLHDIKNKYFKGDYLDKDKNLESDVLDYIVANYALTHAQAVKVERYARSSASDYFNQIDSLAKFAEDIIDCWL